MSRTTLGSRVLSELGYTGALSAADAAILTEKMDLAIMDCLGDFGWGCTKALGTATCTAGTPYVTLPQEFSSLNPVDLGIYKSDGAEGLVRVVSAAEFARSGDVEHDAEGFPAIAELRYYDTSSGSAGRWRLYFKPVPDDSYSMRISYDRIEHNVGTATDLIPTPPELTDLVILNTVAKVARHYHREDADSLMRRYEHALKRKSDRIGDRGASGGWKFHDTPA